MNLGPQQNIKSKKSTAQSLNIKNNIEINHLKK